MVCPVDLDRDLDALYIYCHIITIPNMFCLTGSHGLFRNGWVNFQVGLCQGGELQLPQCAFHYWSREYKQKDSCDPWNELCRAKVKEALSQGVTHSLGRHARKQSINDAATLSTNDSNRGKLPWGHYCGKSAAMCTHASKRPTRLPRKAGLARCSSMWIRTGKPKSRERAVKFYAWQGVVFSFSTYTHTHTHIQITRGVRVAKNRHHWSTCTQ